ncbi:MAG: hypothetical protein RL145_397, partial [Pseudomonadota bacterium]
MPRARPGKADGIEEELPIACMSDLATLAANTGGEACSAVSVIMGRIMGGR